MVSSQIGIVGGLLFFWALLLSSSPSNASWLSLLLMVDVKNLSIMPLTESAVEIPQHVSSALQLVADVDEAQTPP
jgi:hypothetical protein